MHTVDASTHYYLVKPNEKVMDMRLQRAIPILANFAFEPKRLVRWD